MSGNKAGGALCLAILGLLHIAFIIAADFSGGERPEIPRSRFMVLALSPPEAAPPAPAPPPEPPAEKSLPPPLPAETPPAEPLPAPEMPPAGLAEEGPPEENPGGAVFAGETGEAVQAGPFRRAVMSEADYRALVMRRLEERKIYPLSMRKRGIAGEAAVYFTIRPDGSLGSLRAGEGPAHPFLAQAALETVRSAAPFPVMEGRGEDYSLRVTIRFQLE